MLIYKIVLSVGIIAITTYIGNMKAEKLKNREYILRDMVSFLKLVKNEILYMRAILPNAYESARHKLSSELNLKISNIVIDMLKYENSLNFIETSIVNNVYSIDSLSNYDKNIFSATLKNLGRSDVDGQINIIENTITIIENQIAEANEIKLKSSKVYKTVGMITGLMIVVVFI
ncbi:MAG: stage III sporulation protein AB [Clostridia bacterium]